MDLLVAIHSQVRWLVLLAGLLTLAIGLLSCFGSGVAEKNARQVMLAYVIAFTVQVLLGIVIYFAGNWWTSPIRQFKLEHPLMMLIALGVAHITAARARRAHSLLSAARMRSIGAAISLALVLVAIPWNR